MDKEKENAELLKELLRHPGWKLLEDKIEILVENAQIRLNTSTKDTFDERKGAYDMVKLLQKVIVIEPLEIVNIQGVKNARP